MIRPISDGTEAEEQARKLFKSKGYEVQKPDLLVRKGGEVICVEVKDKAEPFQPPPFLGHGLNKSQVYLRMKLLEYTSIRTYLMIFDRSGKKYGQFLEALELGEYFDTRNGVRIYPLTSFNVIGG